MSKHHAKIIPPEKHQRVSCASNHNEEDLELIRKRHLAALLKVSPWTINRWVALGKFPPPLHLSDNIVAWRLSTISAWLAERDK